VIVGRRVAAVSRPRHLGRRVVGLHVCYEVVLARYGGVALEEAVPVEVSGAIPVCPAGDGHSSAEDGEEGSLVPPVELDEERRSVVVVVVLEREGVDAVDLEQVDVGVIDVERVPLAHGAIAHQPDSTRKIDTIPDSAPTR